METGDIKTKSLVRVVVTSQLHEVFRSTSNLLGWMWKYDEV